MPYYEVFHVVTLTSTQKQQLAQSITEIHSSRFGVPKIGVYLVYTPVSEKESFRGGKVFQENRIHGIVRIGSRSREEFIAHTKALEKAWDDIWTSATKESLDGKDIKCNSIFLLGSLTAGMELGFIIPEGGKDIESIREQLPVLKKRAEDGDDQAKVLIQEIQEIGKM